MFHISLVNLWHSAGRSFSIDLLFRSSFRSGNVRFRTCYFQLLGNDATVYVCYVVLLLVVILMSGLFTPISSMPEWAQLITRLNPLRYFMEVMRMVYLKGSGFFDLLPQFGVLLFFAVVFNSWAVISYRKNN